MPPPVLSVSDTANDTDYSLAKIVLSPTHRKVPPAQTLEATRTLSPTAMTRFSILTIPPFSFPFFLMFQIKSNHLHRHHPSEVKAVPKVYSTFETRPGQVPRRILVNITLLHVII